MLNDEQRKLVEESMWVVNSCMELQGITDEDIRQNAFLCLCRCAEKYDSTRPVKFTTYAFRCVYLDIKTSLAKEYRAKNGLVSIENAYDITDEKQNADYTISEFDVRGRLTHQQQRIFDLLLGERNRKDIRKELEISKDALRFEIEEIRNICEKVLEI